MATSLSPAPVPRVVCAWVSSRVTLNFNLGAMGSVEALAGLGAGDVGAVTLCHRATPKHHLSSNKQELITAEIGACLDTAQSQEALLTLPSHLQSIFKKTSVSSACSYALVIPTILSWSLLSHPDVPSTSHQPLLVPTVPS